MTLRTYHKWIAAVALATVAGFGVTAQAQVEDAFCGPGCDFDAQWFAPVDFDYNCLPIQKDCGYFFNYSKLAWTISGERTTIGQRGLTVPSEVIFPLTAFSEGTPPDPYQVQNGIQEAPPDATIGWGDRYEMGYFSCGKGWMVGVLDGPRNSSTAYYGFDSLQIGNAWPAYTDLALLATDLQGFPPGTGATGVDGSGVEGTRTIFNNIGSSWLSTSRNGFGSVAVNFDAPAGYFLGFRDYHVNGEANAPGPTVAGPGRVVETRTIVIGDGVDGTGITEVTWTADVDALADDLDGDTVGAFFVVRVDDDGDGVIDDDDPIVANGVDFDDLHLFNVFFDNMIVRSITDVRGVELMGTLELDNTHLPVKEQRNHFALGYGVRFFKMKDQFFWDGHGSVLGRTYVDTEADNQIVGPQLRAMWTRQNRKFSTSVDGRFMFGYNVTDRSMTAAMGEDLIPGGLNSLIMGRPTFSRYGAQDNEFSPLVELRAEGRYQATRALALKVGYTAMYVDNVTRASEQIVYRLPDFGLGAAGNQDVFVNGVDFGIELVH
ncbi:MAG: hypothetical protein CMJ58_11000 [Planctomycetaceae bacterium]|nr:hypothetical protein [Planctomycetaceae bacterium]